MKEATISELSVIIPAYNEEKTIIQILEKIKKNSPDLIKYEVIVINDGSTDQSGKLLEKTHKSANIEIPTNKALLKNNIRVFFIMLFILVLFNI